LESPARRLLNNVRLQGLMFLMWQYGWSVGHSPGSVTVCRADQIVPTGGAQV
jgi:hypothetical protein